MAMMSITTINSTRVKPSASCGRERGMSSLPIGIFRSIQCDLLRLGGDVKQILTTKGIAVGIILHGTHRPLGFASHGIYRDATQELQLLPLNIFPIHEFLQIRRIILAVDLGLKCMFFGGIMVLVD